MTINAHKIVIERYPNMVVNHDYASLLARNGLLDFDQLYHFKGGNLVKRIKERSVIRITLEYNSQPKDFFIKKHLAAPPDFGALLSNCFQRRSLSPGMTEFENICDFRNHNLATVTPVAAGQRHVGRLRYESFLVTEDVAPYISLEELIMDYPERLHGPDGSHRKRLIIKAIARLASKMHDKGFNHRDFNATHVLIPWDEVMDSPLGLFDLQRVDRKKWLRPKWFIKTMAELGYTMPSPLFDEGDRQLLFHHYRENTPKRCIDPLLHLLIRSKIRKIERHTEKIRKLKE